LARQRAALLQVLPDRAGPLAASPGDPADGYFDGLELVTEGKPTAALLKLVPYTDAHPEHFMAWYLRGVCHEAVAQFPDAAAAFTVCVNLWPDFPGSHFERGYIRLKQFRYAEAEADFTRALDRKPNWTDALFNRAVARYRLKDARGAEADLTAVLARPDGPTRAYLFRSQVRAEAGDKGGAEADAAEGRKREPRDAASWIARAFWRLKNQADPKGALADYDAALAVHPRSADALRSKAAVLADHLNQPAEAVAVLDQLLELFPYYTEGRAARAVYVARTGDAKRAVADANRVLAEEPTGHRLFQMAGVYAQLSKGGDAAGKHKQKAMELLARAFRSGFEQFEKVEKTDPDLKPIRDDADFKALVEHAKKLQVAVK
jgi:tetratricopeptide (TPR) repeat protein